MLKLPAMCGATISFAAAENRLAERRGEICNLCSNVDSASSPSQSALISTRISSLLAMKSFESKVSHPLRVSRHLQICSSILEDVTTPPSMRCYTTAAKMDVEGKGPCAKTTEEMQLTPGMQHRCNGCIIPHKSRLCCVKGLFSWTRSSMMLPVQLFPRIVALHMLAYDVPLQRENPES